MDIIRPIIFEPDDTVFNNLNMTFCFDNLPSPSLQLTDGFGMDSEIVAISAEDNLPGVRIPALSLFR